MSGVAVIRQLLANNFDLLEIVETESRVLAGDASLYTTLPAVMVTQIDGIPSRVGVGAMIDRQTDRVQVTALSKGPRGSPAGFGYPQVKQMMEIIRDACPNQRGTVDGIEVDSIITDLEGPDLFDAETNLYSKSRDFLVTFYVRQPGA